MVALVHLLPVGFVVGCVFGSVFAMGCLLVMVFVQPALSIKGLNQVALPALVLFKACNVCCFEVTSLPLFKAAGG
jgi:hypothetical protein